MQESSGFFKEALLIWFLDFVGKELELDACSLSSVLTFRTSKTK